MKSRISRSSYSFVSSQMATTPLPPGMVWDQIPSSKKATDMANLKKEMEIADEEQDILQFWCSLEGKTSFEGQGILFTNFLCFRSKSQARKVTVGKKNTKSKTKMKF